MKIKDNIGKFFLYTHTNEDGENFFTDFYIDLSLYTICYFFIPVSEDDNKMGELVKICLLDKNYEESQYTFKFTDNVEKLLNDFVYEK